MSTKAILEVFLLLCIVFLDEKPLFQKVHAVEVEEYYQNCYMCTGMGNYFCEHNFFVESRYEGRCYTEYNDKFGSCAYLNFLNRPSECERAMKEWQGISITDALCDQNFEASEEMTFVLTL